MTSTLWIRRGLKPAAFVACLIPAGLLLYDFFADSLGANPIEEITHRTGTTTLVLLLCTLGVTPARILTGLGGLITLRRMLGLFAFTYGILHFLTWMVLDHFFAWTFIVEDIVDRPYITVGFTALVLMVPLAITSTRGWVRRLGGRRWNRLHRLVYVSAAGGVLHYLWLVKIDTRVPTIYGLILVTLLVVRVVAARRGRARPAGRPAPS